MLPLESQISLCFLLFILFFHTCLNFVNLLIVNKLVMAEAQLVQYVQFEVCGLSYTFCHLKLSKVIKASKYFVLCCSFYSKSFNYFEMQIYYCVLCMLY